MLNFNKDWRFDSPGEIDIKVVGSFTDLIGRIAGQRPNGRKSIFEHFKRHFAGSAGRSYGSSSNESWAETDLSDYMTTASKNAPMFIEAMYDACVALETEEPTLALPGFARLNRVLTENEVGYEIRPPDLLSQTPQQSIAVVPESTSLDEQARKIIQKSLADSDQFMLEGRPRQAVQEVLWLLETVSTAFQGLETDTGTIQGKYFNKIAAELRNQQRGTAFDQILNWISTLHGYLSSPTGGGVRHGTNIKVGVEPQPNEARLYCNLIRSYILFLMAEHERLSQL